MQCVHGCHDPNPKKRVYFEQPVIQTAQMFVGEMGSWLVIGGVALYSRLFSRKKRASSTNGHLGEPTAEDPLLHNPEDDDEDLDDEDGPDPLATSLTLNHPGGMEMKGWKVVYLALPACCDIAGTTLMNVGLLFVAASIYQMTRGALVLFVGLFSVLFLRRHLGVYKWFALFIVVAGVAIVGLAGAIAKDHKAVPSTLLAIHNEVRSQINAGITALRTVDGDSPEEMPIAVKTVIGVLLIAAAQIFTATQFVVEESIMEKYSLEPLKAVAWEGIWGFLVTVIGMVILHFSYGRTAAGKGGYFDAEEGLWQMTHFRSIGISSILIMISIGGFNFFGLSVTRTVSATSRSTIDTCRTLFIWIVSLGLGWETFKWLQVVGFALLVYGTFLFNDIINPPLKACMDRRSESTGESDELLPEHPVEHN